jgi:integrase
VRLHDLRHLHASVAIKEGMDPKMLADRLGHARASFTLDVYTHLFEKQRASSAVSSASLILQAPAAPN